MLAGKPPPPVPPRPSKAVVEAALARTRLAPVPLARTVLPPSKERLNSNGAEDTDKLLSHNGVYSHMEQRIAIETSFGREIRQQKIRYGPLLPTGQHRHASPRDTPETLPQPANTELRTLVKEKIIPPPVAAKPTEMILLAKESNMSPRLARRVEGMISSPGVIRRASSKVLRDIPPPPPPTRHSPPVSARTVLSKENSPPVAVRTAKGVESETPSVIPPLIPAKPNTPTLPIKRAALLTPKTSADVSSPITSLRNKIVSEEETPVLNENVTSESLIDPVNEAIVAQEETVLSGASDRSSSKKMPLIEDLVVELRESSRQRNAQIHHSDWYKEDSNGQQVRFSSCHITLQDLSLADPQQAITHLNCSHEKQQQRVMASLQGLPPLPKSLSGFNLLELTSPNATSAAPLSRPSRAGPSPPLAAPRVRKSTGLDAQLAVLRKEMFGLRQLDLSLLSQLWSLNESIQEFRQLLQEQEDSAALSPPSPSSADEGEEFYSPLPRYHATAGLQLSAVPEQYRLSSSSSQSSIEYGNV